MNTSETTAKVFTALTKAAAALTNPLATETAKIQARGGANFSYSFAPLDEIVTNVRATLSDFDLAMLQEPLSQPGAVGVTTRIVHVSGEWIEMGPLYMPAAGGAQDHGSALTYARRYAILAALLLAAEDDDGAKAQQSSKTSRAGSEGEHSAPRAAPTGASPGPDGIEEPPSSRGEAPANVTGGEPVRGKDGLAPGPDRTRGSTRTGVTPSPADNAAPNAAATAPSACEKYVGDGLAMCQTCQWMLEAHGKQGALT